MMKNRGLRLLSQIRDTLSQFCGALIRHRDCLRRVQEMGISPGSGRSQAILERQGEIQGDFCNSDRARGILSTKIANFALRQPRKSFLKKNVHFRTMPFSVEHSRFEHAPAPYLLAFYFQRIILFSALEGQTHYRGQSWIFRDHQELPKSDAGGSYFRPSRSSL
jgi:hypothetical protein